MWLRAGAPAGTVVSPASAFACASRPSLTLLTRTLAFSTEALTASMVSPPMMSGVNRGLVCKHQLLEVLYGIGIGCLGSLEVRGGLG